MSQAQRAGDSRVRAAAAGQGVCPARLAMLGTCCQPTAAENQTDPKPQTKSSPRHRILSHPRSESRELPQRLRRGRADPAPDSPAPRGCCSSAAALWAAGLPRAAIRDAATGFFCIRGVSALGSRGSWQLRRAPRAQLSRRTPLALLGDFLPCEEELNYSWWLR